MEMKCMNTAGGEWMWIAGGAGAEQLTWEQTSTFLQDTARAATALHELQGKEIQSQELVFNYMSASEQVPRESGHISSYTKKHIFVKMWTAVPVDFFSPFPQSQI